MKKTVLALLLLLSFVFLVGCEQLSGIVPGFCQHRDADDDSLCDKCGEDYVDGVDLTECKHRDSNDDSRCDICDEEFSDDVDVTCEHIDANDDNVCDKCEEEFSDEVDVICQHRDADDDSSCDKCGDPYTDGIDVICQHRDADDNSACDKCGDPYTDGIDVVCKHRDADDNYTCDNCGDPYTDGIDVVCKHRDADDNFTCDKCGELYTDGIDVICDHVDANDDYFCDRCGNPYDDGYSDWWEDIAYEETNLIFQMTNCTNSQELSSGCERYLAGESGDDYEIDRLVELRNEDAYIFTNVNVTYMYYPDITELYGYSKCIDIIYNEAMVNSHNSPDMYCNFMTDMVIASLKGCFANLNSRYYGEGEYYGKNYFDFSEDGYMPDLMGSLTLSSQKMYLVASNYFIDIIRSFYVIPVNAALYNSIANDMVADLNRDSKKDIEDLFFEVKYGDWSYRRLAEYSAYISAEGRSGIYGPSMDDTFGFAVANNAFAAAGLLYTSSATAVTKTYNGYDGTFELYYPESNQALFNLSDAIIDLFSGDGVIVVTRDMADEIDAQTPHLGVRSLFARDQLLFGGIILLGSIEYPEYQQMKANGGFGILPTPTFEDDARPMTGIHPVGKVGAIAVRSHKFVECTAFLQYQSTKSTEILNNYYDYDLTYNAAAGYDGNVEMLRYMRENVRTMYDRTIEDAIGYMYANVSPDSVNNRLHSLIANNSYKFDIEESYKALCGYKNDCLKDLIEEYGWLPQ